MTTHLTEDSLNCGGLEPNPQYPRGMSVSYFSHYSKVNGLQMPHQSAFWLTLKGAVIPQAGIVR